MRKAGMEGFLGGYVTVAAVAKVHEHTISCCKQMLWTEVCTVYK
jgi:hypothetical protein